MKKINFKFVRFFLLPIFSIGFLVLLLMHGVLFLFEDNFIFKPAVYPSGQWTEKKEILPIDIWLRSADGTRINAWYLPHPNPQAVILLCHGNSGNITHAYPLALQLNKRLQASILIVDYRGYGKSEGKTEEQGMIDDAIAARTWLIEKTHLLPQQIILFGHSMGTGVAVNLAAKDGAKALILWSPFSSLRSVVQTHYPLLAAGFVMHNQFDSLEKIKNYHGPLLILHGDADVLIPISEAETLFSAANTPKTFVRLPGLQHNDPMPEAGYIALSDVLTP